MGEEPTEEELEALVKVILYFVQAQKTKQNKLKSKM